MSQQPVASAANELGYVSSGLHRHTNWWGAFVIGLAGTILVTGIAPVMATTLGASSIPSIIALTLSGWILCLIRNMIRELCTRFTGECFTQRKHGT